jgi:aspartokinase-like uncharacterized kinase
MVKPWIVKLGGSLATSPDLSTWLQLLDDGGGGRAVIVPGGGRFADVVRDSQRVWCFNDAIAHHMALLAMVQYGLMLSSLGNNFVPADSTSDLQQALRSGRVPVWLPVPMALQDKTIEPSWRLTSDSLALWLAKRLQAACVILVKSAAVPAGVADLPTLVKTDLVDALFQEYSRGYDGDIICLGPADRVQLVQALKSGCYDNLLIMQ